MRELKIMMENERNDMENELSDRANNIQSHYERERALMLKQVGEAHEFVLYLAAKCDSK